MFPLCQSGYEWRSVFADFLHSSLISVIWLEDYSYIILDIEMLLIHIFYQRDSLRIKTFRSNSKKESLTCKKHPSLPTERRNSLIPPILLFLDKNKRTPPLPILHAGVPFLFICSSISLVIFNFHLGIPHAHFLTNNNFLHKFSTFLRVNFTFTWQWRKPPNQKKWLRELKVVILEKLFAVIQFLWDHKSFIKHWVCD